MYIHIYISLLYHINTVYKYVFIYNLFNIDNILYKYFILYRAYSKNFPYEKKFCVYI